uniref:Uncharacterized protein n=1 Tax=Avena sativa TaxID=4498 RepID=A0ACD5VMU5_AVESA
MSEEEKPSLPLDLNSSPGTTTVEVARAGASTRKERARRRAMSGHYDELAALLPDLAPRASRADILDEATAYIRALEDKAAELAAYRAVAARRSRTRDGAAEMVLSGETSSFAVRLRAARPGDLTRVIEVFHGHSVPVLAATVVRNGGEAAVTVTTAVVAPVVAGKIEADIISSA